MNDDFEISFEIQPTEPVYAISIVSQLVHIPVWTLRLLDKEGLVKPKRLGKKTRCYSLKDLQKLKYIHYLMEERGVNIKGVKMILEIGIVTEHGESEEEKD